MRLRPLLIASVAAAALTAAPSAAAPAPSITDPAGDAGPLTFVGQEHGTTGSVGAFDVVSADVSAVKGGTQFTLTLAAAPVQGGYYLINFDAPGCTGAAAWPSSPVQPPTSGPRFQGGTRVVVAYPAGPAPAGPFAPSGFVDCVSPAVGSAARHPATFVVSGSTITWTVPHSNPFVKKGAKLTKVHAFTATAGTGFQDTFMDVAGPGRDYTVR